MATKLLTVDENERVDLGDFEFIQQAILDNPRQLAEQFLTNPSGAIRHWILRGFAMTNPTAKDLTVTRGAAILGWRDGATVKYGMVLSDGDATKTLDLTSYASSVHGIYIRFEYNDGENAGRVFWNNAAPGSEYAQTVATRRVAG